MLGGHSHPQQPDAELLEFFLAQKLAIEQKTGHNYHHFEVVGYT